MKDEIQKLMSLDKVVSDRSRLSILIILSKVDGAEWRFLESLTKLTRGNLNSHLGKLESVGYIRQIKHFNGKIPQTLVSITPQGVEALSDYCNTIKRIIPGD
jgi:DNA-binding MarR family transcriptional regulator